MAPAKPALPDPALELVAARFRALGDPSRLRLLARLIERPHSVHELVEATGLSQPNVSRHLAVLRREGMVERRSAGGRILYRVADPSVERLCRLVCSGIERRLESELGRIGRRPPRRRGAR